MTEKLRTLLKALLQSVCPHVWHGTAAAGTDALHLVFNLQELSYDEDLSLQELEINVMDYGTDTGPAETLADQLQRLLDHYQTLTEDFEVSLYREKRQPIYETDKQIIRRRLTFQVRLYERS